MSVKFASNARVHGLDKLPIKRLEANDLIFELALPDHLGQDGSGGKGF
jgi:hypothetical protein